MAKNNSDTAGVIFPPPLIYGLGIGAGLAMEYFWPLPFLPGTVGSIIGMTLITIAVFIAFWAIREFRRAETSPSPHKPSTAIISSGPFGITRNPLYVGLNLIMLGMGCWVNSLWVLLAMPPTFLVLLFGVVFREERYLEEKFGKDYLDYKNSVQRWFWPFP